MTQTHQQPPQGLRYSREHAWAREEDDGTVTVGITGYAADQLGKLVYIDMPSVGDALEAGEESFDIESGKSISPFVSPVSGEVTQVNETADDDPTIVNSDPYGDGWLVRVAVDGGATVADGALGNEGLMDADEYEEFVKSQG